jgi:hypothetical protein
MCIFVYVSLGLLFAATVMCGAVVNLKEVNAAVTIAVRISGPERGRDRIMENIIQ